VCRHLAYLGPPASLGSLLIDPPHSLYRQAWAPRRQRYGTVNADGFGIGWYAGSDPVPARYRRGEPIWGDPSFPDIARVISSGALLAAVRSATPGTASGPEAAAPFGSGPWLFSHNGVARGWRDWGEAAFLSWTAPSSAPGGPGTGGAPGQAATGGAPGLLSCLEALSDAALLWALTWQRLRAGLPLDAALAGTIAAVEGAGGTGRLNLLLTDGRSVAATAYGDTLWYRQTTAAPRRKGGGPAAPGGAPEEKDAWAPGRDPGPSVTVASEPDDDGPGWTEVPDRHVLTATRSRVRVRPLRDLARRDLAAARATEGDSPADGHSPASHARPAGHVPPDSHSPVCHARPARHAPPAGSELPASHASSAAKDVRTEGIFTA
jgi:glutamine amidotransferase